MNQLPAPTAYRLYPLLIALMCVVSTLAYACGGDGDTSQTSATAGPGAGATPGLPADFPLAPNATISAQTEQAGQALVALTTPDAAEDVASYYAVALSKKPWLTGGRIDIAEQHAVLFSFANVDHPNVRGSVSISRDAGDRNTIVSITYSTTYGSPSP